MKNWYTDWFDTPFYHILYQDRDIKEAQLFMDKLILHLDLKKDARILDLACGRGRHAIYLNSLGFRVTGVDLSSNNIQHAKTFENETLNFKQHDMSIPYSETFDVVFNLFTSFGYFENEEDNFNTILAIKKNLNPSGYGVIDFMNTTYITDHLVADEKKKIHDIEFHIKRYFKDGYIFKDISFTHNGKLYSFTEKVKALGLNDFKAYFKKANIDLLDTFGDYKLNTFNEISSERLVLVFK